jgi:hypothetical protein
MEAMNPMMMISQIHSVQVIAPTPLWFSSW